MRDQHDIPVLLTGCLAAGGAGMFLIMSVLIGFGVSTLIGREAMYLCQMCIRDRPHSAARALGEKSGYRPCRIGREAACGRKGSISSLWG